MSATTFAAFGEVMLRLCPEGKKRFIQVLPGQLEATFGGGEANVCASLAILGKKARYLTALPDNPIARAFATHISGLGVDASKINFSKTGRMGVYYAEHGSNLRGSNVIYDRAYSTISLLGPEDYDFNAMLDGVDALHLTGITPALSENAFLSTRELAKAADAKGITISVDLNYRKKLWNWKPGVAKNDLANECMRQIAQYATIIGGNEEDAADVFGIHADGTSVEAGKLNVQAYIQVAATLAKQFPKVKNVAFTLRESISADHNNWGGMLYDVESKQAMFAPLDQDGTYAPYQIKDIVDRFGGGDSFFAGLLYAKSTYGTLEEAIRFAVAASALKHTISGDYNYSTLDEVLALVKGNATGRVKR
ncbi:MAG: sugar kinase [Lentisphaerae bacterium]|jgi:2-dehydro-3-deoxygluconokinase|nr:sugar kinase [Lentisphaerota bacterium]